jgi:hypothetical protein
MLVAEWVVSTGGERDEMQAKVIIATHFDSFAMLPAQGATSIAKAQQSSQGR